MKAMLMIGLMAWLAGATHAEARMRVVATVSNMGMLAREVGGNAVRVNVLSPPNRDAHYLEARPSMMARLRRADLVVSVGAELEVGWLPAAIQGANNRRVQPGQPGYFEAARKVELLRDDKPADRALGDVHPQGNPHLYLDPERMAQVALALATRMGELDADNADMFRRNAEAFAAQVAERMPAWRKRVRGAPGALAYHSDMDYLLNTLGVPVLGHIEPLPGIPPTAAHLRALVKKHAGGRGVIWSVNFHPAQAGEFMARELGWPAHRLPSQIAIAGDAQAYFNMIEAWVATLESSVADTK